MRSQKIRFHFSHPIAKQTQPRSDVSQIRRCDVQINHRPTRRLSNGSLALLGLHQHRQTRMREAVRRRSRREGRQPRLHVALRTVELCHHRVVITFLSDNEAT